MNLGKSQNLEFLRSGPSMMSMDYLSDSENIWRGVFASSSHIWPIRTHLDHVRSIWSIDRPYGPWIIHMDDVSCGRWRGRYDRWNVFERKHFWEKMVLKKCRYFCEFICFSNRYGSMIVRTAPFLRSISMRKCLILNFRGKCGRSFLF